MSDVGCLESLDWEVITYADMIRLKYESQLSKYNGQMESAEVASRSNASGLNKVLSGSSDAVHSRSNDAAALGSTQVVADTEEVITEEVVTTETVQVETNVNVQVTESAAIAKVASETIKIMTQLNSIDVTDRRRRQKESVQGAMARPKEKVEIVSIQASLEIDEWEVVPDKYLLGVTRSVMDEFKAARAAKILSLDRDIEELVEKFNKIDILTMKWIKKQAENVRLLSSPAESLCPSCKHLLAKKKKNLCKICSTVICPNCSKFVEFKATRQLLCPNSIDTVQSKVLNKYYEMLRLCETCERLIELRKLREERHSVAYPLVEKHQALRDLIEQSKPIVAIFNKINQSLMNGETQYHLSDSIAVSQRITALTDEIHRQAREISATAPAATGSRQATLLAAIKNAAFIYVKDNLSHLRLPTQTQVEEARQNRFEMYSSRLRFKKKQPVVRKKNS